MTFPQLLVLLVLCFDAFWLGFAWGRRTAPALKIAVTPPVRRERQWTHLDCIRSGYHTAYLVCASCAPSVAKKP